VEELILLIVALGAFGAIFVGMVLLYLYFRAGRGGKRGAEPVVYGNLLQCPHCGYMNPVNSAACLNCRQPLPRAAGQSPAPPAQPYMSPNYEASFRPTLPPNYPSPVSPPPAPVKDAAPPAGLTVPSAPASAPAASPAAASIPSPAPVPPNPPADLPPGMPRAWFEGISGVLMGHTVFLEKADTLVGRSTQCDIQVYDPKVSRRHFMIRFSNQAFFLQDQQSSRGTTINGEKVTAQKLNNGDRVELGDTSLIFHIE
jgi:hypothetical protein